MIVEKIDGRRAWISAPCEGWISLEMLQRENEPDRTLPAVYKVIAGNGMMLDFF